jgi:hypothetical protein
MRVKVNSLYRFEPVLMDRDTRNVETNDIVRVINLYGCPPANTMGQAYIQHLGGEFIQMVCTGSLVPLTATEKKYVRRVTTKTAHRIPSTRYNLDLGEGTL